MTGATPIAGLNDYDLACRKAEEVKARNDARGLAALFDLDAMAEELRLY